MKKLFYLFAAITASAVVFSCAKKELDIPKEEDTPIQTIDENKDDEPQPVITITASIPEDIDTKITITEESNYSLAKIAWENDDQIRVIGSTTSSIFDIDPSSISMDGKQATFTLRDGQTTPDGSSFIILYHPENPTSPTEFDGKSYDGQIQDGNGSLAHLNCAMKLEGVDAYNDISFSSDWAAAHNGSLVQNSVLQMLLKLPEGVEEVYSIYVKDDGTFAQTLWLKDRANMFVTPNSKNVVKGYMMVPDMNLADGKLTVRVETEDGAYEQAYPLTITDWAGGAQYTIQKDMSGLSVVTGEHAAMEIHAACAQDILQFKAGVMADNARFIGATVTLEKNIDMADAGTWSTSIPNTFAGTFDGNSKTLSNLTATVPLFEGIAAGATVKDFTLEGVFTYTHLEATNDNFGALAKQIQGSLSGVTVTASLSLMPGSNTRLIDFGGLVGRANSASASISYCHFNGEILIPSGYTTSGSIRLGGLVGCITKALTVEYSTFGGTIKCLGHSTKAYVVSEPGIEIGGIVGRNQSGTISNCSTSDAVSKASISISEITYKATIVAQSANSNFVSIGGIAGFNLAGGKVQPNCSNYATVFDNITKDGSTLDVGGVVGHNSDDTSVASVAGNNYAVLTHLSSSPTQHLGGVVGYDLGTLGTCYNQSGAALNVLGTPLTLRLGGVVGEKAGGSVTAKSTIRNRGTITVSAGNASSTAYIGGVIGNNTVALDGDNAASPIISNNAAITVTPGVVTSSVWAVGGVVGYTSANLTKVSNNGGSISFTGKYSNGTYGSGSTKNAYIGGVLGLTNDIIEISECKNDASVTYSKDVSTKTNGCPSYVGGIVGGMGNADNGAGKITNCVNTGTVSNSNSNNSHGLESGPLTGGIVGAIIGKSDQRGSVSGVRVSYDTSKNGIYALRGDVGGIAGYASYTDFDGTSCSVKIAGAPSSADYHVGGAIGFMVNSALENFGFSGIISGGIGYMGGLVYNMDAASSIEDCTVNAEITGAQVGSVVHTAVAGASIKNCGVYGTINSEYITIKDSVTDYSQKATISGTYLLTPAP